MGDKCEEMVYGGRWRGDYACGKTARAQADGKWFCKTHDPRIAKARDDESFAKFGIELRPAPTPAVRDEYLIRNIGRLCLDAHLSGGDASAEIQALLDAKAKADIEKQAKYDEAKAKHDAAKERLKRLRDAWPNITEDM